MSNLTALQFAAFSLGAALAVVLPFPWMNGNVRGMLGLFFMRLALRCMTQEQRGKTFQAITNMVLEQSGSKLRVQHQMKGDADKADKSS